MQLFVLGMHRSGTSGVTRLLNMAGAYFGPEGMSNGSDAGNPKGFWERLDVRSACDGLLHDSGFDWWKVARFSVDAIPEAVRARYVTEFTRIVLELDAHRPWVVKEPRLSLLFPLLRPVLELPVCIHVTREPIEVADSLRTRNDFPGPVGLALWERYTIDAFRASIGLPRLLVRYEDLLATPVETVTRLVGNLTDFGVHGLRVPSDREITAYISADLHRERRTAASRRVWMNEQQAELAEAIDDGSILDESVLPSDLSESARQSLLAFEDARAAVDQLVGELEDERARTVEDASAAASAIEDERARALALQGQIDALQDKVEQAGDQTLAANGRVTNLERDLRAATARYRIAAQTLRATERDVRALSRSRSWRVAWRLTSLRKSVRGRTRAGQPLTKVLRSIQQARRELDRGSADAEVPPAAEVARATPPAPASAVPAPERTRHRRPKVAVLAWDVGHNPLGRAHVLAGVLSRKYHVEIWGAEFERYGSSIWEPLRGSDIPIRTFEGGNFPEHRRTMMEVARRIDADAIWVSKPRLPSYALGVFTKQERNRPLVLDVDDHELSFFDLEEGADPRELLAARHNEDLKLPFGGMWTRACQPLIEEADGLTVSNIALQARFGGIIVPHARDERRFDPDLYDRDETRRRLGIGPSDRLLLFGGTPRVHKGIVELLRALERLGDDRYRVLLFGTRELNTMRSEIGSLDRWTLALPYQSFEDLPRLVGAADLACVLQDPNHPVSRYQLPAKITDALAMGVPCLVRPVPPLRSLVEKGVLQTLEEGERLHTRITEIFENYDDAVDRARQGRKLFEEAYSYEAVSEIVAPIFEDLMDAPPPVSTRLRTLIDVQRELFGSERERNKRPPRVPGRRHNIVEGEQYDIVMFWKQNDTGIYGRRQDMFVKYLAKSGRVRCIVHFDKPITPGNLYREYRRSRGNTDQSRLVVRQTVSRLLRRSDDAHTHFYTFLYAGDLTARLGLRPRRQYTDYVMSILDRHGFGRRPTILWAYPTNNDLPDLIDALDADIVVTDVVDDHRTFTEPSSDRYENFENNYREVLARSDVVLANCEPVAASMSAFAPAVHVVPNGLELSNVGRSTPEPKELQTLAGPIIGYVGNLSQRIDIPLLDALVRAHPAWQFVFVGSAHHDKSILALQSYRNVHFVGVRPYDETVGFIEHFDVALIPHLDNEMTRSMNPLKAFVYCATGVPVVSTPVANLGELEGLITIARGPVEFAEAIQQALQTGRQAPDLERLAPHSWEARIALAIDLIDRAVGLTPEP